MFRKNIKGNNGRLPVKQETSPATGSEYMVDIQQVDKIFETPAGSFQALRGVTLQVKPGDFLSVIGKSGSGKSTLINMITGIDRPSTGQVKVNGAPIDRMNEEQISIWRGNSIGVVFQFFQLLPTLTAVENVMLAMDYSNSIPLKERPQRAMNILEQMGVAAFAHAMPGSLSGGQQQVVAIARALANDPPIIAADEPTGNLDSKTAEQVFQLFGSLAESGKTVLMVTHDSLLAQRAWRTIVIADGRIVDQKVNQPERERSH
jgi:putative ABC transport system ATP-binding protein